MTVVSISTLKTKVQIRGPNTLGSQNSTPNIKNGNITLKPKYSVLKIQYDSSIHGKTTLLKLEYALMYISIHDGSARIDVYFRINILYLKTKLESLKSRTEHPDKELLTSDLEGEEKQRTQLTQNT
jgi:hypothetical protein